MFDYRRRGISMGFKNKFMNKMDNYKSKQSENSDIKEFEAQIKKEKDNIDDMLMKIGEYYWNIYNSENSDYIPPEDASEYFESAKQSCETIEELKQKQEERRASGEEERQKIDEETAQREAEEKQRKEEARMEREAQKAAKRAEKEEEKSASEDSDDDVF